MRFLHMDRWGEPIGDGQLHRIVTASREQGTDGTDTLTITTATPVTQGDIIAYRDTQGLWHEHTAISPETIHDDNGTPYWTITAPTILNELALKGIDRYKTSTGAMDMLRTALDQTRFTPGIVESNGVDTALLDIKQTNALDMLQQTANLFDLEIEETCTLDADHTHITGRTINLRARKGDRNGRRIEWGHDLKGIRVTTETRRPITRLTVYGKSKASSSGGEGEHVTIESVNGGLKYLDVTDPALLRLYGRPGPDGRPLPSEGFIEYDTDDPKELLRLGKAQLTKWSQPSVTYEVDAYQLAKAGTSLKGIGIGDTIQVLDREFPEPLRLEARVLKISEDLLDGAAATKLTFGNITSTLTKASKDVANTVQKLWSSSGAWNDAANTADGFVNGVINGLNRVMNTTGGYVYMDPGEGITVYDKPRRPDGSDRDATMAIQLGGGYFRIANSRKTDGTWDWRTMGTGAGLVADVIVAGIIRGGANEWNLETGDLMFTQGLIHDKANKNRWDLTNSKLTTVAMVATDSILTGEFTSDSDAGDVHINQGIMDILRDINDESKGVLRFRSAPPLDSDGFGIYTQGSSSDLNIYTTQGGVLQLGAGNGDSLDGYIRIENGSVTIRPRLTVGSITADSIDVDDLSASSASFNRIPDISGSYSGEFDVFGNSVTFDNGIATGVDTGSGGTPSFDAVDTQHVGSSSGNLTLEGTNAIYLNASHIYVQENKGGTWLVGDTAYIDDATNKRRFQFVNGVLVSSTPI